MSVVAPVIRIVRRRVMREDRSPSAGASREYHNDGAFRTASLLQPIAPHRSAQPMRQGPYGQRWPTQMAARRCPLASPSSQEVTICSSESSCWWPWRPPSRPAGQGPRVHLVPRPWHRSTRQPRAASRASPRRRRDLTTHASRRRRVLPGTRRLAVRDRPSSCRCYAPAHVRCPPAQWRARHWVTYPRRAHKPQLCG